MVWGRNGHAVAAIYEAKGRPSFNPLIVHVRDAKTARRYVTWSDTAEILASAFWPGPLTLVLPLRDGHGLSSLVTAGLDTVALRVPAHASARRLLAEFRGPVAAPSANPSGRISANPTVLRAGGLPQEAIEAALGSPLAHASSANVIAPGQLASHYAPGASVRLNAAQATGNEVLLGFGPVDCDLNLSPTGNLVEAAATLFDCLHQLDALQRPIAVAPIPAHGLGRAINDRLQRAAAPR